MKRPWTVIVGLLVACAGVGNPVLYAQALPATVLVTWNPNPVADAVTGYEVTVDAAPAVSVGPTPGAAGLLEVTLSIATYGKHMIAIVAKNAALVCDPPGVCVSTENRSDPTVVTFTLSAPPGNSSLPKLQRK